MSSSRRLLLGAICLGLLSVGAGGTFLLWRGSGRGAVARGRDVAATHGCFGCHGPGGVVAFADALGPLGDVPSFAEVDSYARNEAEIREWIHDGMPARLRERAQASSDPPILFRMPAYGDILSDSELDDLVTYVKAKADFDVPDSPTVEEGLDAGARLGCFTCHGPQGRGATPNPRSLKGFIPPWDGPDFPELAQDSDEVREWILDGAPRRLRDNIAARFFLDRQVIQMPAYRGRISEEDVERLVRYIQHLRPRGSVSSNFEPLAGLRIAGPAR